MRFWLIVVCNSIQTSVTGASLPLEGAARGALEHSWHESRQLEDLPNHSLAWEQSLDTDDSIWLPVSGHTVITSPSFSTIKPPYENAGIRIISSHKNFTIAIDRLPLDDNLHPVIQHQQQRNRLSKRWGADDDRDYRGALFRHHHNLARSGIASGMRSRSLNSRRGVNNFASTASLIPSMPDSVAVDEDGTDVSYFCTVRLGSAGKPFKLVIDTGSSDVWVPATTCASAACSNHASFGSIDSSTFQATTTAWDISYGSGTVSGVIAKDYMSFGSITTSVPVSFGVANVLAPAFTNFPSDGILGLGNHTASAQKVPTVMDNLMAQGIIDRKILAVNLQRAKDLPTIKGMDGQLTFGTVDVSKFYGRMVTTPNVSKSGLWEAKIQGIYVGGQKISLGTSTGIIDTGTTLLLAPPQAAVAIHAAIPGSTTDGAGSFSVPCTTTIAISIAFGGTQFFIDPRDYVGAPTDTNAGMCLSNIIGQKIGGDAQFLLGDVFLKNVYTAFDFDNQEIGFGAKGPYITNPK